MAILAIDWGEKRIGLAISDETNTFSFPYKNLESKNQNKIIFELVNILCDMKIGKVVIGLPLNFKMKENFNTKKIKSFAKKLQKKLPKNIKIFFINEIMSSSQIQKNYASLTKKRPFDKLSAALILESFLASHENANNRNSSGNSTNFRS